MKSRLTKDIVFLLVLVVAIWLALKILLWALGSVLVLAVIAFVIYLLYRIGFLKGLFRK